MKRRLSTHSQNKTKKKKITQNEIKEGEEHRDEQEGINKKRQNKMRE